MMPDLLPGVYRQDVFPSPGSIFLTGVPIFLGITATGEVNTPSLLTVWPQFEPLFGPSVQGSFLAPAVRSFFENDGLLCYVLPLALPVNPTEASCIKALEDGLTAVTTVEEIDLICVPDLMGVLSLATDKPLAHWSDLATRLQQMIVDHCQRSANCFAILDTPYATIPNMLTATVPEGKYGAYYYPWLVTVSGNVPPCGHVAGLYSRSDQRRGPHKPPANEPLAGVLDLTVNTTKNEQIALAQKQINCLIAFPGRGIRVWGARTAAGEPINVRRLLITVQRWLEKFMTGLTHEPNDIRLWVRIMREVTAYLDGLFRLGALKGRVPEEAFYVKCDGETNPPEVRQSGRVVTDIGLAPVTPAEFILVRVIHGDSGVTVSNS